MSGSDLQLVADLGQLSASGAPAEEVDQLATSISNFDQVLDLFGLGESK